ncbi:MAG: 16S rRNA (adenine(1518)-N(6)/adenine(1519)-N(6))-dimethyltransferase RsmA [Oscillospiraceae bacterium]|nr:16S rRNA (adenine(1518)-N(6)/adenine(1519)-N(6))-dimethyltransferase RsmA [Oscillospiraceae bacterium]
MERFGRNAILDILNNYGLSPSKAMGQNFLIDGNITDKIVRLSGINKTSGVLEVGPGFGSLTEKLSLVAGKVIAVELDKRLIPILDDLFQNRENVEILHGDILKLDLQQLVGEKLSGYSSHVCANLPYNITSPVISAFLDSRLFETITVMVQREVARRICAQPGSKEYGSFTVYVNYHSIPQILFDVPPDCFMPKPKVWSSVIHLKIRPEPLLDASHESAFFKVLRAAFAQRRKTLANALYGAFGDIMDKEDLIALIKKSGHNPIARGETMGLSEFIALSEEFIKKVD